MYGRIIGDIIPNCVPEYYRSLQEDEDHRSELRVQRYEHYRANEKKIKEAIAAGLPILLYGGYESCWKCKDADYDTMTDDEDDMGKVICHNLACILHKEHEGETR